MRMLNALWSRRASQDSPPEARPIGPLPTSSAQTALPRGFSSFRAEPPSATPQAPRPHRPSPDASSTKAAALRPRDARRLAAFGGQAPSLFAVLHKQKLPPERYAHLQLPFRVVQCIAEEAKGAAYTTTPSQVRGSYAKVKWGIDHEKKGVCIKQLRLSSIGDARAPAFDRDGLPKTCAVTLEQAAVEVEATRHLRAIIDAHIAEQIRTHDGHDPLGVVRTRVTPFEVHGAFVANHKLHMVTSLESGDVCQLQEHLPAWLRYSLSWSVGAQVADELSAIYDAGYVHLDVKLENLLFSRWGQVKLADWMTADTIDTSGLTTPTRGITGSLPAPDMVRMPHTRRADGSWRPHKLTPGVDTWQLAVALLRLLVDPEEASPFVWHAHLLRRDDVASMREHLVHFENWRRGAFDATGHFALQSLDAPNIFARYLKEAHKFNPMLVVYLLQHVLVADSQLRAKAPAMAAFMYRSIAALPCDAFVPLADLFKAAHKRCGHANDLRYLRTFHAWYAQTPKSCATA